MPAEARPGNPAAHHVHLQIEDGLFDRLLFLIAELIQPANQGLGQHHAAHARFHFLRACSTLDATSPDESSGISVTP